MTGEPLYTGPQAALLAGISYRQLDYWTRMGVVTPEVEADGSGSRRGFTEEQVKIVAALGLIQKQLVDAGFDCRHNTIPVEFLGRVADQLLGNGVYRLKIEVSV